MERKRIVDYQRIVNLEKKVAALEEQVETLQRQLAELAAKIPTVIYVPVPSAPITVPAPAMPPPPVFPQPVWPRALPTIICKTQDPSFDNTTLSMRGDEQQRHS